MEILPFRPIFQMQSAKCRMQSARLAAEHSTLCTHHSAFKCPAGSATQLSLPGGVKVARRPVKPFGVGASPTLAATILMQSEECRMQRA